MNTPTTYIWINIVTEALKIITSAIAPPANIKMPLLNASRSPRVCNWCGRYPSLARMDAKVGKPLKAVLAARKRMTTVTVIKK